MAAYEALVSLNHPILTLINQAGIWFSKYHPSFLETLQYVGKELKPFQEFVEGLDVKSRRRMNVELQRVTQATNQFRQTLRGSYVDKLLDQPEVMFDKSDEYDGRMIYGIRLESENIVYSEQLYRDLEEFRKMARSFIDTLKEVEEEYLKIQDEHEDDDEDEDEDEAPVDLGGKMVGLSDVYSELKRVVVSTLVDDHVVSLCGMTGIGKTTLAKKLFQDLDVLDWFEHCVWVTVGMRFQPQEITRSILAQMDLDPHDMTSEDYLRKELEGKRYLIVFDDVCDMELCQSYIKNSFPEDDDGSKVLLTTRIQDNSLSHHLIPVRLLDKQESWDLLCDKVFAQTPCPLELEKAGKMIAEKCDGLPLTIVTVAKLLSKTQESLWIQVATQKKHQLFVDAFDEISKVLYPIYVNLSEDLKLGFLYMGVFPQNYKIPRSKLINLWIVEKIIQKGSFQTLEDSGIEILQRLAMHSFVMVYQRSTIMFDDLTERIKRVGLHSSWWQFCYRVARDDTFYHVLDSHTDASEKVLKSQSRLTVHNNVLFGIKAVYKSMEENCTLTTHSLLCLGPYHQYPVPICFGLKLLKKFDALHVRFYHFPLEILELVKLRYLALTCNGSLPPSIAKLSKLQYLMVHQHLSVKYGEFSYLPVQIWDMKRLKHLHVKGVDLPDHGGKFLLKLLTLSGVSFNSCTSGVVSGIPNLKKLGIQIELMPNEVEHFYCFDHISHFKELQSLKCVIVNPTCNFKGVAPLVPLSIFPVSLKKLYLGGLGYPWEEASMISSLPNLEALKLRNNAFKGPEWAVEDCAFPKLCCLVMEDLDLMILKGGYDSFTLLEKVSIKHCYNLKTFRPTDDYNFLANSSEVIDCNPLVGREIQKSLIQTEKLTNYLSIKSSWNS